MKFVPKGLSRFGHGQLLKLSGASPTLLVVGGVVGLGVTVVLAAKASRNLDPVIEDHQKARDQVAHTVYENKRDQQKDLLRVYVGTTTDLARLYGPALIVGSLSAGSVLYGHKILRGRHIASIAAYTGLMDQFGAYRSRVAKTLGADVERGIYEGAHGEWTEDPDHKGEHKLTPKFDPTLADPESFLRPWFDERNVNWTKDPTTNFSFLKGAQAHFNNVLSIRKYLILNEVLEQLGLPKTNEGMVTGWVWNSENGDNIIDFGFMSGIDPHTVEFRNGAVSTVQLNFNIDGNIYGMI